MKWPLPLRLALPLMLLLFAGTTGFITLRYGNHLEKRNLRARFREHAQFLGTKLSGMTAYYIEGSMPSVAQREIAITGADPDLRLALVFGPDDKVLFSSRYDLVGRTLADSPAAEHEALISAARAAHAGQLAFSPDGRHLFGAFAFPVTPRTGGAVRDVDFGAVFLDFDLSERLALLAANLQRRAWLGSSVLLGLTALFSALFGPMLTSRVRHLSKAARQLASGDLNARADLRGGDELAELSHSFDQMAGDLQRSTASLSESEARFRFLVESIPQVFWLLELNPSRVLYVGPAFERVWGRRAEELYTDPTVWIQGIHPDDRDRARKEFAAWLAGLSPNHDTTYRVVRPNGDVRWIRDRGARLETSATGRKRVVGIAEDITEQRQAEADRDELERKLQETQKLESLGVLAGGIAHDFNNLLTGILGNAALARQELTTSNAAQPHLAQIEAVTQRAADLCKQMLAYSGKGRFQVQRLDLSALVRETTQLIQLSIDKTAVLRFNLTEPLTPVEADATQMRQVIMNLVINASEALGGKSGVITLNTGLVRADRNYIEQTVLSPDLDEGDYAFIEVCDNGCGMTPEQQARIFEPFFTTKFTGRGLGLSAVLGIVRGHRGALRIYSEAGKGTTFKVILPTAPGAADPLAHDDRSDTEWSGTGTILIVDDEQTVRTVAARMVEKFGFASITAINGRDGVEKFREHRGEIVAVLMDLTMPHMDGETAFRELRTLAPDVRVILTSGFNEQDAINRFTGKGLAGFLQKPFKPDALRRKLKEALEPS